METLTYFAKKAGAMVYEYIDADFPITSVSPAFAQLLSDNNEEVSMNNDEFKAFVRAYDAELPHDWVYKDGFRGVKIIRV